MSDLCDRQYALEHYQHVCRRTSCKECPMHIKSTDVLDTFTDCELELFLYNLPSAQPERKRGKWIDQYQDGDWHCSCCGAIVEKEEQTLHNWYFCYHCGSRNEVEK